MVADKKVFFGALFEFHTAAREELINRFKESLNDEHTAFVSYDKENKAFTFTANRRDDHLVSLFAGHLKTYIDEQADLELDPYQSPKIRPFDSTVLQDHLLDEAGFDDGNEGLLAISDSSSDEAGPFSIPGHTNISWKPQHGKIAIMTEGFLDPIKELTGCSFYPNESANQIVISGADPNVALRKLQNLEKLQTHLASHRSEESSKAIANILMLANPQQNLAIQFLPLIRGTRPYERIIVTEQSQIRLDNKCIAELRYTSNRNAPSVPPNLLNPSGTAENRPFSVWSAFSSLPRGKRANMEPRRPPASTSKTASALHAHPSSTSALPASLLLPTETRKIESWAENIDEGVNPNDIAVEPPKESAEDGAKIGRQRRVASVDSDSEDEPRHSAAVDGGHQPSAPARLSPDELSDQDGGQDHDQPLPVANDSTDDEALAHRSPVNPQTKSGRRRRVEPADSDDSGDLEPPFTSATNVPKTGQSISNLSKDMAKEVSVGPPTDQGTGILCKSRGQRVGGRFSTRGSQPHSPSQAKRGGGIQSASNKETGSPGQSRSPNSSSNVSRGGPQSGRGQLTQPGRVHSPFVHGRGNARSIRGLTSTNELVDIGSTIDNGLVNPPPGLNIKLDPLPTSSQSDNLLDEPLNYTDGPSTPPLTSPWVAVPPNPPEPAGRPAHTSPGSGQFYVNTFNPRPDVTAMEEEQRQKLLRQRGRFSRSQKQASNSHKQLVKNNVDSPISSKPSEHLTPSLSSEFQAPTWTPAKLQGNDEFSTRRFHGTMGQGTPNPGKNNEETKKEKQARIAKAKAEAHGDFPLTRKSDKSSSKFRSVANKVPGGMSASKLRMVNNSSLVIEAVPAGAEDRLRQYQTKRLLESLRPLFEMGRVFSGRLKFEVQFGQVISAFSSPGGQEHQFIDVQEWHRRFHPQLGMLPQITSFTNILTTNGADADRILEMKSLGAGSGTVWSKIEPIPKETSYEFQCQTEENEEFWLVVNQDGSFKLRPPQTTVGMVNLHFPGHVWDACAVVAGVTNHRFAELVEDTVNTFLSSLYIPPGLKKISITYRLPDANMTVRNLVVKRKSVHSCNLPGKSDFQLHITEVQTLYHQFHKDDKKLAQGFVKDYPQMINDGRLHYEFSLVHEQVNKILEKNADLELGELAHSWTESDIFSKEDMRSMVDLTRLFVSKIDGVGSQNIGTLLRKDVEKMIEEKQLAPDPVAISSAAFSRLNPGATTHIPGVRGGKAEIVWENGQPYAYGYGGALVPLADRPPSGSDDGVPDDSASQAGPVGLQMPSRSLHLTQAASISTTLPPKVGHGFW